MLKKGVAVFLTLLLVGSFFPGVSEAATLSSQTLRPIPYSPPPCEAILEAQKEAEANPDEAKKPKEMEYKRTKNAKKFVCSSGVYLSKTYPRAIHKKNSKGGWDDLYTEENKPLSFYTNYLTWVNEQASPNTDVE